MAKATPLAELEELHRRVAKSLNHRIQQDMDDDLPTDAAALGVAIKFLKDNCVTADPADSDHLELARAFERQSVLLTGIGALFNLTDEQIDAMFIYGAEIQ